MAFGVLSVANSTGAQVAMSVSIGIVGSIAVPVVAYLAYMVVRARSGAVPKKWK